MAYFEEDLRSWLKDPFFREEYQKGLLHMRRVMKAYKRSVRNQQNASKKKKK